VDIRNRAFYNERLCHVKPQVLIVNGLVREEFLVEIKAVAALP
jgi:hypothetical protein